MKLGINLGELKEKNKQFDKARELMKYLTSKW